METRYPEVDMSAKHIVSKCPIEELIVLIGGRWKPVILWWLFESQKPLRFKNSARGHAANLAENSAPAVTRIRARQFSETGDVSRNACQSGIFVNSFRNKAAPCTAYARLLGAPALD